MTSSVRIKYIGLVLILVLPLTWLLTSTQGKQLTDRLIMKLLGRANVSFQLTELNSGMDEKTVLAKLKLADASCQSLVAPFGDRLCLEPLGTYNGVPARYVAVFFNNAHLSAIKLSYQAGYHQKVIDQLHATYGKAKLTKNASFEWKIPNGTLIAAETREEAAKDPSFIWIAKDMDAKNAPAADANAMSAGQTAPKTVAVQTPAPAAPAK